MSKSRVKVNKKLMISGFHSLNSVRSVDNSFQLILISFVASAGRKDKFDSLFMYMNNF